MRRVGFLSLLLFLFLGSVWGQASGGFGAVTGVIREPGGDGIPDTTVVLSNASLGSQVTMITTDDGVFNAPTVAPAEGYTLKATRKSFRPWVSGAFAVSAGQRLNFEIGMEPEQASENSRATGGLRTLNDTENAVAETVPPLTMNETPDSGRRLDPLVALATAGTPGNSIPGTFVFHAVPYSNASFTDGIYTTDSYFLERPGVADQVTTNTIQDFQVASSTFAANFGRAMGGVVDAATRSGTIGYHGEAYEYYRNRSMQAADRYAMGYNTKQLQHQAGASVGGPVYGNKIFFFLNLGLVDRNAEGLNRITNPLIADPTGTHVLASNCTATAAQCAAATKFIQSQMNVLEPLYDHLFGGLAKIDYRRSDRNTFSFDANDFQQHMPSLAETETVAPNGGLIGDPILREQTRFAAASWTATGLTRGTNSMHLGYYEDRISEDPVPALLSTGNVGISIAGTTVGATQPYTAVLPSEHRLQYTENANWTVGSHLFNVGADISRTTDYINSLSDPAGWYTYNSLTAFAQDLGGGGKDYATFNQTFGTAARTLQTKSIAGYGEDTWRASPRLTIDYGVRYERTFLPQPTETDSTYYQTGSVSSPWLDISPRVGFAYMANQRTVVRVGYGWYYEPFAGQVLDALFLGNGLYQTNISVNPNQTSAPGFPAVFPSTITSKLPTGFKNVAFSTGKFRNPYAQEISAALERQVKPGLTVTLSLMRTDGRKLWTTQDTNLAVPQTTTTTSTTTTTTPINETYTIDNAAGQAVGTYTTPYWTSKQDASYAHAYQIENSGSSWYDAVVLQARKQMSHGFSMIASYTWSHAIDDLGQSSPFVTTLSPGVAIPFPAMSSTFNANYIGDKGNSTFDQRHRGVIQALWRPGAFHGNPIARSLFSNWEVSTLTTLASSEHETPIVIVQGQQFSGETMAYTTSLNGSGGWARVPFDPVNSLNTGPEYNVDGRIARTLTITERVHATLMFEAFNALNMQYNTSVNNIAYIAVSPTANGLASGPHSGILKPVPGLGLGNAAQGYPDGANARRLQVALRITF